MSRRLACSALALLVQVLLCSSALAAGPEVRTIAEIAAASPDHTTLVAALKAVDYVDSLKNPGPFTVFAPNNAAFDKLPKGTVEGLLKTEKLPDLKKILEHHVMVSVYEAKWFKEGEDVGMVDGTHATMHVKDGKVSIDGANILASIRCSNGIIHVVDSVVLPPAKPAKK